MSAQQLQQPPLQPLAEELIVSGFHSILKDSLAQVRGEGLLSDEEIETGDVDVQIAGPALCLFFSALGAQGDPPTIAAPDRSFELTSGNCPPSFASFFKLWQQSVRPIKKLSSEARHDLALLLCDKEPVSSPLRTDVIRLASDLKAVSLEITQRRTFQARFQADLQHALDSNVRPRNSGESDRSAMFVPPPGYIPADPSLESKRLSNPSSHPFSLRPNSPQPTSPRPVPRPPTPSAEEQNLSLIRETLYSALADCIVSTPSILALLARGPEWASRAYFASTSLAILEVALTRVSSSGVRAVHLGRSTPRVIGAAETPEYLRPFFGQLVEVAQAAQAMAEEDDEKAMKSAAEGKVVSDPKMERLRERLEKGAGEGDLVGRTTSVDGSVAALANAINQLAIGMASLPAFQDRQAEVFKILASVTSF